MRARNKIASFAAHVVNGERLLWALSLAAALVLCGAAHAQIDANLPTFSGGAAGSVGQATSAPAATTEEVTGNNVQIRSDAGTNFYACGSLNRGDRVQVVKAQGGWSAILPPPGCYSWIAVQYVSVSVQNPAEGVITGNNVPVYAGSDELAPMISTTKQGVTMTRGQRVRLLNEEKEEYYKISPPPGAYFWVSSQFLQPVGGPGAPVAVAKGGAQPQAGQGLTTSGATPAETDLLAQFGTLKTQIEQEQKKPLDQQDFSAVKEKLKVLAGNKEGGRAARYAQLTLQHVERCELARMAGKELELQNQDIKDSSMKIDDVLKAQLAKIEDMGKYAAIGKLQPSILYSRTVAGQAQRYQLLDDSGRILCYVSPAGTAAGKDLSSFIGHKVGLVGQILPHSPTARAFVEFSDIVRLD